MNHFVSGVDDQGLHRNLGGRTLRLARFEDNEVQKWP